MIYEFPTTTRTSADLPLLGGSTPFFLAEDHVVVGELAADRREEPYLSGDCRPSAWRGAGRRPCLQQQLASLCALIRDNPFFRGHYKGAANTPHQHTGSTTHSPRRSLYILVATARLTDTHTHTLTTHAHTVWRARARRGVAGLPGAAAATRDLAMRLVGLGRSA